MAGPGPACRRGSGAGHRAHGTQPDDGADPFCRTNLRYNDGLEADLVRARIQSGTGANYRKAVPLFASVQNGGDEKLAAQAIYYQVDAGLNARVIKLDQGDQTSWSVCASAGAATRWK